MKIHKVKWKQFWPPTENLGPEVGGQRMQEFRTQK